MFLSFLTQWIQYSALVLELMLLTLLYYPGKVKRIKFKFKNSFFIAVDVLLSALFSFIILTIEVGITNTIVGYFIYAVLVGFVIVWLIICYKDKFINILFYVLIGFYVRQIIIKIQTVVVNIVPSIEQGSIYDALLSIFLFLLVFVAIAIYRMKKGKRQELDIDHRIFITFLLPALVVNALFGYFESFLNGNMYIMLVITEAIIYFLFVLYELEMLKLLEERRTADIAKTIVEKQQNEYESFRAAVDYLNIKCHDLKHQIREIKENSVISSAAIEETETSIAAYEAYADTGSSALDILMSEKYLQCNKLDIQLILKAESAHLNLLSDADLYSLFGNALDNAIEYEKTLPTEKRIIRLSLKDVEKMLIIRIENYFEGELDIKDGLPQTTKKDKTIHGFGFKSMKYIAEKYKGNLNVEILGDMFCLTFVFPF